MVKSVEFQDKHILYLTDDPASFRALQKEGRIVVPVINDTSLMASFPFTPYILENIDCLREDELDIPYLYKIFCRLTDTPLTIAETDSLLIRETTLDDIDVFYEIYKREPSLKDALCLSFKDASEEKQYHREYIRNMYGFYDFGLWTMEHKATGQIIGRVGFSMLEGCEYPDLGFLIDPEFRRRGYTLEACIAILQYAKSELGFSYVQARVKYDNIASISLLKRLGFSMSHTPHPAYQVMLHTVS